MAIYTGFFDAAFDEDTGTYDREYGSADFTEYSGQIVGSGVCVYGNDDSMKVYYDSASQRAVVNPGYLFIRGYWLRNDGLYTVSLADLPTGVYAIRAVLNMGSRAITIGQVAKADPEEYPDALVLAYATVEAGGGVSVEDTRSRTDICGLIDAAGSLSQKVEYAIYYIDNEIQAKLDQIQQDLQAQEAEIDGKIEEANSLIAQIAPPAIGTIKFSASQNIEEGWLRCDGSFINEADYPELVAALGKNYPSGDKFQLLNTNGVGRQISNGVVCLGRLWVFSYADRKLYGIDVEGDEAPKVIELTSEDPNFSGWQDPNSNFLALSIIPNLTDESGYHLFLSQVNLSYSSSSSYDPSTVLVFYSKFTGSENLLSMGIPFSIGSSMPFNVKKSAMPFVVSYLDGSEEKFYMAVSQPFGSKSDNLSLYNISVLTWGLQNNTASKIEYDTNYEPSFVSADTSYPYRVGYLPHNRNELVAYVYVTKAGYNEISRYSMKSYPGGNFNRGAYSSGSNRYAGKDSGNTSIIAGDNEILLRVDQTVESITKISRNVVDLPSDIPVGIALPSIARPFPDGCTYLWGKRMFMIFVGTGIIFSRDLTDGSFGYLDTTSVLGTITQYASIRYSQDEGTLYIVGQDTTNTIRAAKIVLNTLYDYANDGAWLPMIASDGIPAYIKAKEVGGA